MSSTIHILGLTNQNVLNLLLFSFLQIAGFVIGLIPQLRNLLIGADAPLRVIDDSAALLGFV